MKARKHKAIRQSAYRAGPLAPWRSIAYMENLRRFRLKRGTDVPMPQEIGRVESFRMIWG